MLKWAQVGDLQMPYQDDRAVALWFKIMKRYNPHAIDVVGDISDFLEFSSYSDGSTDEFFNSIKKSESESPVPYVLQLAKPATEFYTKIAEEHPNADKFSALGNHDIRVFSYMDKKAPTFAKEISPDSLWDFKNLGFGYALYEDPPTLRHGGIHVHHGTTVSDTGPAVQKDIEKFHISLIRGHDHRGGVFYRNYPLAGTELLGIATGHMCDPKAYGLRYTINHSWQLGFSTVEIDDYGNKFAEFHRISPDYTCLFKGRLFKG